MADHAGDGLPRLTDQATQQADDGVSQAGEHLGAMALSNLAAVLIERDIADPMEAVLNTPVPPVEGQQLPGVGLFRGEISDAEDLFCACPAGLGHGDLAFDPADLAHMGEIEIGIERNGGAKGALLDPTVSLVHRGVRTQAEKACSSATGSTCWSTRRKVGSEGATKRCRVRSK